jgi:hypothetical protein
VKKLLFPSFADAGANDTFRGAESSSGSDALTEVRDNRSSMHGSDTKSGSTTESAVSSDTEQTPAPPPKARAFFPSTDPLIRPQLNARSISTMAEAGAFPSSSLPLRPKFERKVDLESSYMTGASSILGQHLVGSDVPDDTPLKDNRTNTTIDDEEADDSMSDVNSTASEMGTVIGVSSSRLAEVNAMALMTPAQEDYDDDSKYSPVSSGGGLSAGLSLPMLDEKENNKKSREDNSSNNTASSMMSAAFRRLGKRAPGTVSAPNTPKAGSKVEDYFKSSSFSLRSPGSSAQFPSYRKELPRPSLSPRFSKTSPPAPASSENQHSMLRHATSLASPLRFARGCLSFDNTIDNHYYYPSANDHGLDGIPETTQSGQDRAIMQSKSWDPSSTNTPRAGVASAFRIREQPRAFDFQRASASQPHHATNHSPAIVNTKDAFALRTPHKIEIEREDALDILACLVERSVAFEQDKNGLDSMDCSEIDENDQIQPDDDIVSTFVESGAGRVPLEHGEGKPQSPPKNRRKLYVTTAFSDVEALPSALADAVSALREMSVFHQEEGPTSHATRMKAIDELLRSHNYSVEMKRAAKSASAWLRSIGRSGEDDGDTAKTVRPFADQEAPVQLSTEGSPTAVNQSAGEDETDISQFVDKMDLLALKAMIHSAQQRAKEKEEQAVRLNEELSLCRAEIGRLKSASRSDVLFTSANRSILDNEDESVSSEAVSKANADVDGVAGIPDNLSDIPGNDTSLNKSFVSMIKEDAQDWNGLAEAKKEAVLLKAALAQANDVIRDLHSNSKEAAEGLSEPPVISIAIPELIKELEEYKQAVRRAQQLDVELANPTSSLFDDQNSSTRSEERISDAENFSTAWEELASGLPPPPDHGLQSPIVAALLQQWTSDKALHDSLFSWMELIMRGADPGTLRPLSILSLDRQTRDGFCMHILPMLLKRSDICVDVKTRLHRRTTYDIDVSVTPTISLIGRNQRETPVQHLATSSHLMAYKATNGGGSLLDQSMAVEAGGSRGSVSDYLRSGNFAQSSDIGSGSVSHSTVTAHITNASKLQSRLQNASYSTTRPSQAREPMPPFPGGDSLCDEASVGSSMTGASGQKSGQQAGLMSTIGSTFGGFLSRRNKIPSHHSLSSEDSPPTEPTFPRQFPPHSPYREEGDEQPYHRVVSAPPGRIGVTFVQYRGHAMVSDVAPESPLSGWVFPGDILIAIDEVPVSGMRVRDIVKLLTARKERQRALRVISSHAMAEFTLNQSALSDVVQN